jgi:hypothetical protein
MALPQFLAARHILRDAVNSFGAGPRNGLHASLFQEGDTLFSLPLASFSALAAAVTGVRAADLV